MIVISLWALISLVLAACSSSNGTASASNNSETTLNVVASTNVYGDIADSIAGGKARITSILSDPAADPHSYEPNTQDELALSKADIVIENGGGYDDVVHTLLGAAQNPDATVLQAVDISGKKRAGADEVNEHVWYDVPSMVKLTDALAAALSKADPAEASTFETNATAFKARLDELEKTEASIKSSHGGEGAAITEPVPLYLLQACGLVNKTPEDFSQAIEEGSDVPASVLQQTLDLLTKGDVAVLAYDEQTAGTQTERVRSAAQNAGVPVVGITETLPEGKDYPTWIADTLTSLKSALG